MEVLSDLTDDKFVSKIFENACSECLKNQTAKKKQVCGTKKYHFCKSNKSLKLADRLTLLYSHLNS